VEELRHGDVLSFGGTQEVQRQGRSIRNPFMYMFITKEVSAPGARAQSQANTRDENVRTPLPCQFLLLSEKQKFLIILNLLSCVQERAVHLSRFQCSTLLPLQVDPNLSREESVPCKSERVNTSHAEVDCSICCDVLVSPLALVPCGAFQTIRTFELAIQDIEQAHDAHIYTVQVFYLNTFQ
jgi:hypothetical protein